MADAFDIRLIEAGDKLTGLSLGDAAFTPLKTFIQRQAKTFQEQSLARTYGVFVPETGKLVAYTTLVCGEVVIGRDDQALIAGQDIVYPYRHYPAVKLARLAVDQRLRGSGIGRLLVQLALAITKQSISSVVGCRFLMVDAKKNSVSFYAQCGFTLLDTEANKARDEQVMFIDIYKLD